MSHKVLVRRVIVMAFALAVLVLLAACGKEIDQPEEETSSTTDQTQSVAVATQPSLLEQMTTLCNTATAEEKKNPVYVNNCTTPEPEGSVASGSDADNDGTTGADADDGKTPVVPQAPVSACPQAADLGPWAPTEINGVKYGETYEITSHSGPIKVQLWWPHGQTPWGNREVHVRLDPNESIEVQQGAGRAWDYSQGCDEAEFQKQFDADVDARTNDTNYHGVVTVEELIQLELVCDRREGHIDDECGDFPGNPDAAITSSTPDSASTDSNASSNASCPNAVSAGKADGQSITVPEGHTYVVEAWESPVDGIVMFPAGSTISGYKGAVWDYACGTEAALAVERAQGKEPKVQ
jgi:hypothetical protein